MEPAVSVVVILAAATVVLKKIVDLVTRWVPTISGPWTVLLAVVIGTGIAWFFDFQVSAALFADAGLPGGRELPDFAEYIVAGIAMAGFAGYIHDRDQALAAATTADLEANTV